MCPEGIAIASKDDISRHSCNDLGRELALDGWARRLIGRLRSDIEFWLFAFMDDFKAHIEVALLFALRFRIGIDQVPSFVFQGP